jgi:SAM-dependent methyltransferase
MATKNTEQRYPDSFWDAKADYLSASRILLHNDDYLEFLVTRVWRLDKPCRVVDFGCGAGRFGQMLMPLLPEGSSYTGFDQSPVLVDEARRLFAGAPFHSEFSVASLEDAPFDDSTFDAAISQGVLMHIPDPMSAIREMIRVTRQGGMVMTCDGNRNAHNALLHVEELEMQDTTPLDLLRDMNNEIKRQTGVDHNIGIKTPVLMHRAGLKDVQARVSDSVRLLFPPIESEYDEALARAIYAAEQSDEDRAKTKAHLVKYGVAEDEAETQLDREREWQAKGRDCHTVCAGLLSFSFGTVDKAGVTAQ